MVTAVDGANDRRARPIGGLRRRIIRTIAVRLVGMFYRRVEFHHAAAVPPRAPLVTVVNHFGGFADVLLLVAVLERQPRFIAHHEIWKIPLVRWILDWGGAIPVHRPQDGDGARNEQMFAATHRVLRDGGNVTLFPEGFMRDEPSIGPIKTGAARIALGAAAEGIEEIHFLPVGIHYENRAVLRSTASLVIGEPLRLEDEMRRFVGDGGRVDPSNHDAVRMLTARIEASLRHVAPDFRDWAEAHTLTQAADVFLRSRLADARQPVSLSERDRLASLAGRADPTHKQRVVAAMDAYRMDLDGLGLSDAQVRSRRSTVGVAATIALNVLLVLLLLPFAAVGAVINLLPFLAVRAFRKLPVTEAVVASYDSMVAVVAYAVAWSAVAWVAAAAYGWPAALVALLLMPIYVSTVIITSERLHVIARTYRRWRRSERTARFGDELRAHRQAVVDALAQAL